MSLTLLFIILMLFQQSILADPTGCIYKTSSSSGTSTTDSNYLTKEEKANIQTCFSLSFSDVNNGQCCYVKVGDKEYCTTDTSVADADVKCPETDDYKSKIANNCGMAKFYQPQTEDACTEISLVDGYCCHVKTKEHGTACVRQDEIDEDDKTKIYDEMRDAVKRLKLTSGDADPEVTKVVCEGNYMTYYVFSLLLLAVML